MFYRKINDVRIRGLFFVFVIAMFSLLTVTDFVFAAGGGGGGGGGGVKGIAGISSFSSALGIAADINGKGLAPNGMSAVANTDPNTGSFGVGFSRDDTGEGGGTNFPGFLTPITPTGCTFAPNLTVSAVTFAYPDTPSKYLLSSDLDVDTSYVPSVAVTNASCKETNAGTVGINYLNQPPKGQNGTFPVRLQLDFDKDGNIDYDETVNGVGPLGSGVTTVIRFPGFITPVTSGTHEAIATADPVGVANEGCTGTWGCIKEIIDSTTLTQPFSVNAPTLMLGSVLHTRVVGTSITIPPIRTGKYCDEIGGPECSGSTLSAENITTTLPTRTGKYCDEIGGPECLTTTVGDYDVINSPLDTSPQREVAGESIALVWTGTKINFASCSGNVLTNDGTVLTDFNGKTDGVIGINNVASSFTASAVAQGTYDTKIAEPTSGNFNLYTLTCTTASGRKISAAHILNNGGDTSTLVDLTPLPTSVTIEQNAILDRYRYSIENTGREVVTQYDYTLEINGEGLITDKSVTGRTLVAGDADNYTDSVSWSSSVLGTYPTEVCVDNVNGSSGRKCESGSIAVMEPSISSDVIAPTISATPSLVRVGDTVKVTWNEGTDTGCTLSPQRFDDFVNDNGGVSPVDFPITGGITLRINCDTTSDSAEVRVLPAIYEI